MERHNIPAHRIVVLAWVAWVLAVSVNIVPALAEEISRPNGAPALNEPRGSKLGFSRASFKATSLPFARALLPAPILTGRIVMEIACWGWRSNRDT